MFGSAVRFPEASLLTLVLNPLSCGAPVRLVLALRGWHLAGLVNAFPLLPAAPHSLPSPWSFPNLQFHLALDLHVVIGRFPQSKANDELVTEEKQGEVLRGRAASVNDSVPLELVLLLLLLLEILDNPDPNIQDVSHNDGIRATNSQVFYRTGAYLNDKGIFENFLQFVG